MSKQNKIPHAYCVELDDIVDIYEASEFYGDKGATSRFTFLCSNEECRALIVGVNYDNPIRKKGMYFRRHKDHPHISTCKWHGESLSPTVRSKRKSVFGEIPDELLFDELVVETQSITGGTQSSSKLKQTRVTTHSKSKFDSRRVSDKRVTRSFGGVCNLFRELSFEGKKEHFLTIGSQSKPMSKWFWAVKYFCHFGKDNRVNHGHARVKEHVEKGIYRVEFEKPVMKYDDEHTMLTAYFDVSNFVLKNSPRGTSLKRALTEAAVTGRKVWCFTFGTAKLKKDSANSTSVIEICPVSPRYIELMEIED